MSTIQRSLKAARIATKENYSIWSDFSTMARKHGAVNLGQGFPTFVPPTFVLEAGKRIMAEDNTLHHQYDRLMGNVNLVEEIAKHYEPRLNHSIHPMENILVTVGATEGIYITLQAFINPGDEVIVIEPFYDAYVPCIELAGGKPVFVNLTSEGKTSNDWKLDMNDLKRKVTPNTRMIIVNNPMNVPGKVFTRDELTQLSQIAIDHDLLVMSDQVYDHIVMDAQEMVDIASLPGMYDRTITLGSAGKTFSVTGWKVGWIIGNKEIVDAVSVLHTYHPFCHSTPLQRALANVFQECPAHNYFEELKAFYQAKRDKLLGIITAAGLPCYKPSGAYFIVADISKVDPKHYYDASNPLQKDFQFCHWLCKDIGIAAIPISAFYHDEHKHLGENYVRFAFCKDDSDMEKSIPKFEKLSQYYLQ